MTTVRGLGYKYRDKIHEKHLALFSKATASNSTWLFRLIFPADWWETEKAGYQQPCDIMQGSESLQYIVPQNPMRTVQAPAVLALSIARLLASPCKLNAAAQSRDPKTLNHGRRSTTKVSSTNPALSSLLLPSFFF